MSIRTAAPVKYQIHGGDDCAEDAENDGYDGVDCRGPAIMVGIVGGLGNARFGVVEGALCLV